MGWEIVYFEGSRVVYTHLGCFGTPGRAGGGGRVFIQCQINQFFPIRQAVPVGLPWARFCSWARWARFFIIKKSVLQYIQHIYIQSTILYRSGHVRMDGWRRMGLDDTFPIRKRIPVGLGLGFGAGLIRLGV